MPLPKTYDFIMPHSHEFTDSSGSMSDLFRQRLDYAYDVWTSYISSVIVVAGQRGKDDSIYREARLTLADAMCEYLRGKGVPPSCIIGDGNVQTEEAGSQTSTWSCLQYVHKKLVLPNDWRSGIMVSNVEHLPRVSLQARKIFGSDFDLDFRGNPIPDPLQARAFMINEIRTLETTLSRPD